MYVFKDSYFKINLSVKAYLFKILSQLLKDSNSLFCDCSKGGKQCIVHFIIQILTSCLMQI